MGHGPKNSLNYHTCHNCLGSIILNLKFICMIHPSNHAYILILQRPPYSHHPSTWLKIMTSTAKLTQTAPECWKPLKMAQCLSGGDDYKSWVIEAESMLITRTLHQHAHQILSLTHRQSGSGKTRLSFTSSNWWVADTAYNQVGDIIKQYMAHYQINTMHSGYCSSNHSTQATPLYLI